MSADPDMLFLVYSPLSSSSIEQNLGLADYSYYFVMQRFLPLLREFGKVEIFDHPPTDEDVTARLPSTRCVYLSFTPPNKLPAISCCPVVPVFAWEYSTIPDEEFSCAQDNWVRALQNSGCAITHSRYALDVVLAQLGENFPLESIPAPIWDSHQHIREARIKTPPMGLEGLNLDCTIIDSNDYLISNTSIRPRQGVGGGSKRLLAERWAGEPLVYELAAAGPGLTLIGFNDAEPWGVWSRSGYPWVLFDCAIEGEIELSVSVRGYLQNIGKRLRLEMGCASADLLLSEKLQTHIFRMNIEQATNVLAFFGVEERAVGASDPRDIGLGLEQISIMRPAPESDKTDSLVIDMSQDDLVCEGLHDKEEMGRWTSSSLVTIQLPKSVAGRVRLGIKAFHLLHNHARQVDICLGERRHTVTLKNGRTFYKLEFADVVTTDFICISGLGSGPVEYTDDSRSLGLGIAEISLQRFPCKKPFWSGSDKARALLEYMRGLPGIRPMIDKLQGARGRSSVVMEDMECFDPQPDPPRKKILYTAILNPKDGRKNWEDIITGFVYAFRDDAGATLLIKVTYHELDELNEDIFTFLIELHPFQCQLIFIHGFLSDEQYEQLLLHSHFIVNASRGEGQCLPLMEFMSAGVPAVAPDNSAMVEYINSSNAFIVGSSPEPTFWPQDPRQVFRTMWRRIDWESLVMAYTDSARVYRDSPGAYLEMSAAAVQSQEKYCSMAVATSGLQKFLESLTNNFGK